MKNLLLLFLFIGCFHVSNAQYTELINSRRPGFSDSPFSVGTDVIQFEHGLFYKNIKDRGNKVTSYGTDIMIRYSKFLDKLEINLNASFQQDDIDFQDPLTEDVSQLGFSQLTIGAKYLVYMPKYKDRSKEIRSWKKRTAFDWKRLIPSVAVYAGANVPITNNYIGGNFPRYEKGTLSPKLAIYTQNDFTDRFVFITNLIMDKIGSGQKENSYILTGTYTLNDKWSIFGEHQGIFKDKDIPNDFQFGGGLAYLFSKDKQFDIAARAISDRDGSTLLINAGFSWRIDKHEDKFKLIGSDGNTVEKDKGDGFFSRLFGKKNKKQRKVKKIKAKKRKIKVDKPKKSKAQKRREKEEKKKLKEDKKKRKKELKDYNKNYEPPKN